MEYVPRTHEYRGWVVQVRSAGPWRLQGFCSRNPFWSLRAQNNMERAEQATWRSVRDVGGCVQLYHTCPDAAPSALFFPFLTRFFQFTAPPKTQQPFLSLTFQETP
ncbi:unnamed protein product [Durusdinium trenchii]|uniref:Uncharacterized protein n=1 Tax=Durusdinium trenchii TaxID=1381693 RepID=A0ABP0IHV9_9DINO